MRIRKYRLFTGVEEPFPERTIRIQSRKIVRNRNPRQINLQRINAIKQIAANKETFKQLKDIRL